MYGHPSPHILRVGPAAQVVLAHHTPQSDPVRKTTHHTLWGGGMGSDGIIKYGAESVLPSHHPVDSLYLCNLLLFLQAMKNGMVGRPGN